MARKALIDFLRNLPLLGAVALALRWRAGWAPTAGMLLAGSLASAALISWTEHLLDPDRSGWSWRELASNTLIFAALGALIALYGPRGAYWLDALVGVALGALAAGAQYAALGRELFFDQRRALAAYAAALIVSGPLFLAGLRLSHTLAAPLAAALLLGSWALLSAITVYFNYTLG